MDKGTLLEMDLIQSDLSASVGLLTVIADGLSCYTSECSLSGDETQKYVNAICLVHDKLSTIAEIFGTKLANAAGKEPSQDRKEHVA